MGLLAGENKILESGDKNIIKFKFINEFSRIVTEHFSCGNYNRYNVRSYINGIIDRRITIHYLLDSLNFTEQEAYDLMESDCVETVINTTYDIRDHSERGSYLKIFTSKAYVKRILNGDESVPVTVISKFNTDAVQLDTFKDKPVYKQIKRAFFGVRLKFTSEFREEICNIVLGQFNFFK